MKEKNDINRRLKKILANDRQENNRYLEAYITVEAALVFPMVLMVILFVIYMMFFQYNRCLLDMDMASLTVKACNDWTFRKSEIDENLKVSISLMKEEIYYGWNNEDVRVIQKKNKVLAEGKGRLLLSAEDQWKADISYESTKVNPVLFVRSCNKAVSLMKDRKTAEGE